MRKRTLNTPFYTLLLFLYSHFLYSYENEHNFPSVITIVLFRQCLAMLHSTSIVLFNSDKHQCSIPFSASIVMSWEWTDQSLCALIHSPVVLLWEYTCINALICNSMCLIDTSHHISPASFNVVTRENRVIDYNIHCPTLQQSREGVCVRLWFGTTSIESKTHAWDSDQ